MKIDFKTEIIRKETGIREKNKTKQIKENQSY